MAHDTDMARTGIDMARTGIVGLDDVLGGGLSRGNIFLLEGEPGSGKTTIALQFLLTAAAAGEPSLYVTLSETEDELRDGAASHHWNLGAEISVCELLPPESLSDTNKHQTLLYASELELGETTKGLFDVVRRVNPTRLVIDSLSEIRLLAQSSLRYRRQILTIKHFFSQLNTTVLMRVQVR
jgi:circadian clock protein KaiC